MNNYVNIALIAGFGIVSVLMLIRWGRVHRKVMIADKAWSTLRMIFLAFGLFSLFLLIANVEKTTLDYARLITSVILVTVFMMLRDGVGEEGMISAGKFYPWNIVRSYDYEERKNILAVYFTVESTDEKKPDNYTTKELDFALEDKELLMKFLTINCGRKYTRMKKRKK